MRVAATPTLSLYIKAVWFSRCSAWPRRSKISWPSDLRFNGPDRLVWILPGAASRSIPSLSWIPCCFSFASAASRLKPIRHIYTRLLLLLPETSASRPFSSSFDLSLSPRRGRQRRRPSHARHLRPHGRHSWPRSGTTGPRRWPSAWLPLGAASSR